MPETQSIKTTCCIAGGGPAGMMAGVLLARAGVNVIVLEKHADFFRDFRGDTIHPSTLELMHELGWLDDFLKLPHQQMARLKITFEGQEIAGPDFSHLPTHCKFIALMPQWDFLNFLASQARRYPAFNLRMKTDVIGLIEENGRITGVRAKTETSDLEVRADLVIAADGRHSTVRDAAGMTVKDYGVPIDVLWFRVAKGDAEVEPSLGRIKNGQLLITLDRDTYYQCGFIIRKGAFPKIQQDGLGAFRQNIMEIGHFPPEAVSELDDWNKVKLLTVQINRLEEWFRPGLLCIGDSAHAMSPAGGVGINLAVQDAVAAANLLATKLRYKICRVSDLREVQERRELPMRLIQAIQIRIHRRMFSSSSQRAFNFPPAARHFMAFAAPVLRRVAARIVGVGFRPEHIAPAK